MSEYALLRNPVQLRFGSKIKHRSSLTLSGNCRFLITLEICRTNILGLYLRLRIRRSKYQVPRSHLGTVQREKILRRSTCVRPAVRPSCVAITRLVHGHPMTSVTSVNPARRGVGEQKTRSCALGYRGRDKRTISMIQTFTQFSY